MPLQQMVNMAATAAALAAVGAIIASVGEANNFNAHYAIIIGEQEIESGTVVLRDMTTATQETIPLTKLQDILYQQLHFKKQPVF